MIIDSKGSLKQTIGETTEYKTTIDIENLDFIATLLSSNLYSKPEESFIRETVSNGWDSHVEANNTSTPLIVKVKKTTPYYYDITVRDYGTGLSKEQFENLFCKIGSSTKRESNAYHGCFGLGHLSPLAVSKVCYITSYYDDIARLYIMTKDGNNITTNLMSETSTTEHNGLEIVVKNISNITDYDKAFRNLAFFPNVYIDGYSDISNSIKVKRFKYFSFANAIFDDKILLGNVLYPLDDSILPSELLSFYSSIKDSGVVFNFNIGELNVTPNRESIIYNSKVNALIIDRITKAKEEISKIINSKLPDTFTDYKKYYLAYSSTYSYDFIENTLQEEYRKSYKPVFKISEFKELTFHNKKLNDGLIVGRCYRATLTNLRAVIYQNTLSKAFDRWDIKKITEDSGVKILVIPKSQKLTKYIKEYLISQYYKLIVVDEDCTYESLKNWYEGEYCWRRTVNDEERFVLTKVWEQWQNRFIKIDFNTDKDFLDFKQNLKDSNINTFINESVILTVQKAGNYYANKITKDSYKEALKYIKDLNTGVIIRNLDTYGISGIASWLGYATIAANQKVVKLLEKEFLTCKISEETILKHKKVVSYKTFEASGLFALLGNMDSSFIKTLSKDFSDIIIQAKTLRSGMNYSTLTWIKTANITPDEDLLNACNTIIECYKSYLTVVNSLEVQNSYNIDDIINFIIVKNKLYRVGYDCYKKIKSNKIIKALCQK